MTMKNMLAMAAAVAALGIAGCGDDDEDSSESSTTASITKEEFLTQGNEICAAGNEEIDAVAQDTFTEERPSQAEIETFVTETVIPSVEGQLDDLRALGVPAGEEDQVNEILNAADQAVEEAKADPSALSNPKTDPFADVNKLALDYGLTECG